MQAQTYIQKLSLCKNDYRANSINYNTFVHAQIPSFPMSKKISKESLIQLLDGPASVVNK